VPARRIGTVKAGLRELRVTARGRTWAAPLERLAAAYHEAIPAAMRQVAASGTKPSEEPLAQLA
jgi:hypothetical protein